MDLQNLAYALVQVVHNFGAVAVTGGALMALALLRSGSPPRRELGWLVLAGWAAQAASGAGFGAISYAWYGRFPDLHGIAVAALAIKLACAASGFTVAAVWLRRADRRPGRGHAAWGGLAVLALTALTAAAFLRWFA